MGIFMTRQNVLKSIAPSPFGSIFAAGHASAHGEEEKGGEVCGENEALETLLTSLKTFCSSSCEGLLPRALRRVPRSFVVTVP